MSTEALQNLSPDDLEQVLARATGRRAALGGGEKAGFAVWLAKQHLGLDPHLQEVIYLPSGSPEQEVRLLEVNEKLYPDPDDDAVIPRSMTPAISKLPYRVLAADITPDQWGGIQQGRVVLPSGWSLKDRVRVGRRAP
ncbi:MAG: hypothetical protein K2X87_33950 [Gemmataceae bacterium]|nr:hypothetical protein [Gemmataceae bacterium]